MFAVIGLGNPGRRYEGTRHNIGFAVAEVLAGRFAPGERLQSKFDCNYVKFRRPALPSQAAADEKRIESSDGLVVLPQKYMNLSGQAAVPLLRYFKVEPEEVIVVYDELDLDPGQLRVRFGGSAAGHRGLKDISAQLGTDQFYRIRVGIGHPRRLIEEAKKAQEQGGLAGRARKQAPQATMDVSSWVLGHPGPEEKDLLQNSVLAAADAVETLLDYGLERAQGLFNRKS